jgi:PAS domain S-box-containing protein
MTAAARFLVALPGLVAAGVALAASLGATGWALAASAGVLALLATGLTLVTLANWRRRAGRIAARARHESPASASRQEPDPLNDLSQAVDALRGRLLTQLKELAKKTRNLESLMDALGEPLLVTDNEDKVLMCNRPAEVMVGTTQGGLAGRSVREIFTRAEVLDLHTSARQGRSTTAQVPLTTASGSRVYQVSAAPLPPAWGEGVFGVVLVLRDVTALANAARTRTDFVASASHELRTPVAAIQAAAETLEDGGADDPAMRARLLTMIASHCQRLERLTRNLIELSRLESPEMPANRAPINWPDFCRGLSDGFSDTLRTRGQRLEFEIDPAVADGAWETDQSLLELILRNLIDNAAKFGREGEPIRVTARLLGTAKAQGERRLATLRLEVIDRGIGIPLEHQPRVFERFYQVDQSRTAGPTGTRRGTGLGLALVKHAALALSGQVGLDSVWQRGTTVWVEVPVEG